jgi:four helix bundle protein
MAEVEKFGDLDVCESAMARGAEVYRETSVSKLAKDFGAKDQLRRATISISNNIAEGFEYNDNKVFVKFLGYTKASAGEFRSNLFVLKEADFLIFQCYNFSMLQSYH